MPPQVMRNGTKIFSDIWYAIKNRVKSLNGRIQLDVTTIAQTGGSWTVPDGCSFAFLSAYATQGALVLPTTGLVGQVLFVYNADDAATTSVAVTAGKTAMFIHNGTAWVLLAEQS